MSGKIKVLIVDDSRLIRDILTDILESDPRIQVVGAAADPYDAREMIKALQPDVITLDVEMPKMNGISFLKNLMRLRPLPVVMISTLTLAGSNVTMQALDLGAIDFIAKPVDLGDQIQKYREIIISKVVTAASVPKTKLLMIQNQLKRQHQDVGAPAAHVTKIPSIHKGSSRKDGKVLAIGGSTGGLEAVRNLLCQVEYQGDESIVICLHLPGAFTQSFAARLDSLLPLNVKEATDNEPIVAGSIYLAPGGLHLEVQRVPGGYRTSVYDGEKVTMHKPSVDVLFQSVASQVKNRAMAVLLTGMGKDGAQGMCDIRQAGGETFAQDEASSVVWGMPGSAVAMGGADHVETLPKIAKAITRFFRG